MSNNRLSKREEAIQFLNSMRGQYIVAQALSVAVQVMEKQEYPEYSNIQDIKYLAEEVFNVVPGALFIKEY